MNSTGCLDEYIFILQKSEYRNQAKWKKKQTKNKMFLRKERKVQVKKKTSLKNLVYWQYTRIQQEKKISETTLKQKNEK